MATYHTILYLHFWRPSVNCVSMGSVMLLQSLFQLKQKYYVNLTLKWSRPSALPLVVKGGGSLWTLTQKSTFPNEFGGEMRATDKVIQKNQNTTKKKIENRI